jgi:PAS domain S-box-containing protein
MSRPPLRILHLEDQAADAELMQELLTASGLPNETTRVDTEADFVAALERGGFDLILSDFSLPGFDGHRALEHATRRRPDVPFVFVTGSLGEDTAVEMLKRGATDYVLKDRPSRLPAAVQRALREAEAQRLRRTAETRHRALMEQANDAILILDTEARIVETNQEAARLLGRTHEEVVGRLYEDFVVPDERGQLSGVTDRLRADGGLRLQNRHLVRADGQRVPVDVSISLVRVGGAPAEPVVLAILRDVTERQEAERKLAERGEQYRLLFDSNPHPMWVYDTETLAFVAVNEAAARHYGWSRDEFLGMRVADIRRPEDPPEPDEPFGPGPDGPRQAVTVFHRKKDGSLIEVEVASSRLRFRGREARLVLAVDVTEKRSLAAQLLQSQKIESVGRLAGGIAHDFNNILGVILGQAQMVLRRLPAEDPLRLRVEQILSASERAAGLTRQLLAFSRRQVFETRVLDVNEIVESLRGMLVRLLGEDMELTFRPAAGLGRIRADSTQIEQILMNLAVNARDAMPGGGRLAIETANADMDEEYARVHPGSAAGPYVCLTVTDSGQGMTPEVQARVFEPFFTTKEKGKGTGLGLATVYGIVKQSEGFIYVYSELGHGTTFKIYLPRVEGEIQEPAALAAAVPGTETVLLVEDADSLREMIHELLEGNGYRVLAAADPTAALELAEGHAGPIHLLLTDVVMPRMNGRELARKIKALRPDVRILYMSGYSEDAIAHRGVLEAGAALITKPFTQESLARKLREALSSLPPTRPSASEG